MSKAFTRESDDLPERPTVPRPRPQLPAGTRNYLTPDGARRLQAELDELLGRTDLGAGSESLRERLGWLQRTLPTAEIVAAPPPPHDQVRFGAYVRVRDPQGIEETFRIVGLDEADPGRDWISWLSPLARSLLNARLGQQVRIQLPGGSRQLEIVGIAYE